MLSRRQDTAAERYRTARLPRGRTDWRDAAWAAVDLETTGLDPSRHEIIAIGVVPIDGGRIIAGRAVYRVVRPRVAPAADTIRIHGIRPADLRGAPPLGDVLDDLLDAIAGRRIVAHVAFVERGFLRAALRTRRLRLRGEILDTQILARAWLHDSTQAAVPPHLALGDLARRLELPVERSHHALGDALTAAQAFLALATHLEHHGALNVRSLYALQRRARPGAL
jgi:DNA polymerase-3 subunit epsilon